MRIGRGDDTRQRPARHGLVVAILLFLPLLTVVGLLAPGVVTVQYEDEEEIVAPRQREASPPLQLAHRLLLTAQDYTNRFVHNMVDLDRLFVKPRYRIRRMHRGVELPRFPQTRGDMLVMNDLGGQVPEAIFEDALQPGVVADATATWDPNLFDVIPNTTFPGRGTVRYDDFMGDEEEDETPVPVVPEPGSAALLALGLIALALRARQRQPATS